MTIARPRVTDKVSRTRITFSLILPWKERIRVAASDAREVGSDTSPIILGPELWIECSPFWTRGMVIVPPNGLGYVCGVHVHHHLRV